MATDPHCQTYPQSGAGHQLFPRALHGHRAQHPGMMHQPVSAFRPPPAPVVPLEHRFMQPGQMPSGQEHYQQRQFAPHRNQGNCAVHVPPKQQHTFQSPHSTMNLQECHVSSDTRHAVSPANKVRTVMPLPYQQGLQQCVSPDGVMDPESLNRELRMLHAMHYQEKIQGHLLDQASREELTEAHWQQQRQAEMLHQLKKAHSSSMNLMQENHKNERILHQMEAIQQKHISAEAQPASRLSAAQELMYRQHDELYHPRQQKVDGASHLLMNRSSIPSMNVSSPEMQARLNPSSHQNINLIQKMHPSDLRRYSSLIAGGGGSGTGVRQPGYPAMDRYNQQLLAREAFQQSLIRSTNTQQLRPVGYNGHKELSNPRMQVPGRTIPPTKEIPSTVSYQVHHRSDPRQSNGVILQGDEGIGSSKPLPQRTAQLKQPISRRVAVSNLPSVHSSQQLESGIFRTDSGERYNVYGPVDTVSSGLPRDAAGLQTSSFRGRPVSIKQEQEVLKGLQRAAVSSGNTDVHQEALLMQHRRDVSRHVVSESSGESMPRIIEVRSLANASAHSSSNRLTHMDSLDDNAHQVSVMSVDGKASKHKSVMMKDFNDMPLNAHRVPSRSSMDGESGRKDSWDSGIESPPWTDRESVSMSVKKAHFNLSEDKAVHSNLHHEQPLVKSETGRFEQCSSSCLNTPTMPPAYAPQNLKRFRSHGDENVDNMTEQKVQGSAATSSMASHDKNTTSDVRPDAHLDERKVLGLIAMRKRVRSCEEDCPVAPKMQALISNILDCKSANDTESSSEVGEICEKPATKKCSDAEETMGKVLDEVPLDLSVKKDMPVPGEEKGESHESHSESKDTAKDGDNSESDVQGYFSGLMMRALKRIWTQNDFNFDVEVSQEQSPKKSTESSDEDSGKYFKPSSVTTLDSIPQVDNVDGEHQHKKDEEVCKKDSSSSLSLENVICELMQHSSGAFKHKSDIFQHFDRLIKQELMKEIERRPQAAKSSIALEAISRSQCQNGPQAEVAQDNARCFNQLSEAVPVHTSSPGNPVQDMITDMDDSQELIIVESSVSPEVAPTSQGSENTIQESTAAPDDKREMDGKSVSATIDEMMTKLISAESVYKRAADAAAEKAARLAARVSRVLSSPPEEASKPSDILLEEDSSFFIDVESGLSPRMTIANSNKDIKPGDGSQGIASVSSCRSSPGDHHMITTSSAPVRTVINRRQSDQCPVPVTDVTSSNVAREQLHVNGGRRRSEPSHLIQTSMKGLSLPIKAPEKLQQNPTTATLGVSNGITSRQRHHTADGITHLERPFQKIAPTTTWQAKGVDINKVKLMRVPISSSNMKHTQPQQTVHTVPSVSMTFQQSFKKSPIVILPRMMCVPGQPLPQLAAEPVVQDSRRKNVYIIQTSNASNLQNQLQYVTSTSVPPSSLNVVSQVPAHSVTVSNIAPAAIAERSDSPHPNTNECNNGPFRMVRIPTKELPSTKKPSVCAYEIFYKSKKLRGVVRSEVPFVPPRLLQEAVFPKGNFDDFCHALQDCNVMQRYMTVLERAALLPDLRQNKISSCKLVSLEELHNKWDDIEVILKEKTSKEGK